LRIDQYWKNNIIVGTEEKEGHNEVIEEIIKQLAENDLYVKD